MTSPFTEQRPEESGSMAAPVSSFRWATVTQASPLRLRLDGDTEALLITPDMLIADVLAGDRVWCQMHGRRVLILGRAGGTAPTAVPGCYVRKSNLTLAVPASTSTRLQVSGGTSSGQVWGGVVFPSGVDGLVKVPTTGRYLVTVMLNMDPTTGSLLTTCGWGTSSAVDAWGGSAYGDAGVRAVYTDVTILVAGTSYVPWAWSGGGASTLTDYRYSVTWMGAA